MLAKEDFNCNFWVYEFFNEVFIAVTHPLVQLALHGIFLFYHSVNEFSISLSSFSLVLGKVFVKVIGFKIKLLFIFSDYPKELFVVFFL